jgi:hypothetical protein
MAGKMAANNLRAKKRPRSKIWNHYTKVTNDNGDKLVKCNYTATSTRAVTAPVTCGDTPRRSMPTPPASKRMDRSMPCTLLRRNSKSWSDGSLSMT